MKAAKWILKCMSGFKRHIALLSVVNFISALIAVVYAVCFKNIIDAATDGNVKRAIAVSAFLVALILIQVLFIFTNANVEERAKTGLGIKLRDLTVKKLLHKEYAEILAYHTGEINNRIFSDIGIVSTNAVTLIPALINMAVRLMAAFVVMFFINKNLGLVFLCAGAICGLCMIIFRKKMKTLHKDVQSSEGKVRSSIQETVMGVLLVKVFNAQADRINNLDATHNEYKKKVFKRRIFQSLASCGMNIAYNTGFLFAFFWCIAGIIGGTISYGTLTAVLQLTGQIQGSVQSITGVIPTWFSMSASAERIMELIEMEDEKTEKSKLNDIESLKLNEVSFSYDKTDVLKDVSLSVNKGEVVALLGISGAGKSTLFMLLMGIYKPKSGEIFVSKGDDTENISAATRHLFSYVPQDNKLFSGTIRDNLKLAADVSDEKMYEALRISCADFINEIRDGLDSVVGENGIGLSEGQRQRIAIARAIISDAPVILFDEATSALDEETEKELIKNLSKINRTSILITHRRSVLEICDRAYTMTDGKICELEDVKA